MNTYKIANIIVSMDCSGKIKKQAKPYLFQTTEKAQIQIDPQRELAHVQNTLHPQMTAVDWEYMLTGSSFYRSLLKFQGFLLHASAVVYEQRAYLFSAPCGTGKSTHTSLWLKQFPDAYILNDDKPAIRLLDGCFYACGTPWSGKDDISVPACVPLQGVCFLQQAEENSIRLLSKQEAVIQFMSQTIRKLTVVQMNSLLVLLDQLLLQMPIYQLNCRIDAEAVQLSYRTMKEGKKI